MASSSLTPVMKEDGECINWADLPYELTSSILGRLDTIDILENAQKVCTSWRRVCKDPAMWRKIVMRNSGDLGFNLDIMCRHAVDRSQGGLVEINIWHFATDSLLNYIADRSSNLRSLAVVDCSLLTSDGLAEAIVNLPLLEELEVSYCSLYEESLKIVGQSCPNLKTLKLNRLRLRRYQFARYDDEALAIAETMPRLSHLQLFGNYLTDSGLSAILDKCPDLEYLDVRKCHNLNLYGDLKKRCSEKIKVLRGPCDSVRDYVYLDAVMHIVPPYDPYPYCLMQGVDYDFYDNDDEYDPF